MMLFGRFDDGIYYDAIGLDFYVAIIASGLID